MAAAPESITPPYEVTSLPAMVAVLPVKVGPEGGLYTDDSHQLVKLLRAAGVDAAFLDPPPSRRWRVQMGDVPVELIIGVVSGLASMAIWTAVAAVLRRVLGKGNGIVTIVEIEEERPGHKLSRWSRVEGDAETIEKAILAIGRRRTRKR